VIEITCDWSIHYTVEDLIVSGFTVLFNKERERKGGKEEDRDRDGLKIHSNLWDAVRAAPLTLKSKLPFLNFALI
jgi:hypothetical protein